MFYKQRLLAASFIIQCTQYATIILTDDCWYLSLSLLLIVVLWGPPSSLHHSAKTITWPILAGWYRQLNKHRIKWLIWRMIVEKLIIMWDMNWNKNYFLIVTWGYLMKDRLIKTVSSLPVTVWTIIYHKKKCCCWQYADKPPPCLLFTAHPHTPQKLSFVFTLNCVGLTDTVHLKIHWQWHYDYEKEERVENNRKK